MSDKTVQEVILQPEEVRKQFPNALLAIERMQLVRRAEAAHKQVKVYYADYFFGRTVLQMEVI